MTGSRLTTPVSGSDAGERQAEILDAVREHADGIFELIDTVSRSTTVLPRPREVIEREIERFAVAVEGGRVIGCGSLVAMSPDLVEIRSLAIDDSARGTGLGSRIARRLVDRARAAGYGRVFVLTDSPRFFARIGFTETRTEHLPQKVWNDCRFCPRFDDCNEVAMEMDLTQPPPAPPVTPPVGTVSPPAGSDAR